VVKKRISPTDKSKILDEVFVGGQKVSTVCRKWGISRFSFYNWVEKSRNTGKTTRERLLSSRSRRGFDHYKYIKGKREKLVLECVLRYPQWSSHKISDFLETYYNGIYHVSNHGVANILKRYGLNSESERQEYSRKHLTRSIFPNKFTDFEKYKILEEYLQKGKKIAEICRQYHISRFTFYAWLKRYSEGETVSSLSSRRLRGEAHWKYAGETVKQKVIDAVVTNPIYSVHKLYHHLAGEISHHAIQNVLARENLNLAERRFAFAQDYVGVPGVAVAPLYEVPVPRLTVWRLLFAPFKTVPKWVFKHPASWPFVFPALLIFGYIFEIDKAFRPTIFFPAIALTFGFFFFLYSMKYYISLIIVMRISQKGMGAGEVKKKGWIVSLLEKYFKLGSARISRVNLLLLNLEKVELTREPFVSLHLAVYNEKRVVERLIEACQNQQWSNYEVILADDSTDETTEIAKKILGENGRVINRTFADENLEIFISTPPAGSAPVIKLIHRFSRDGFKGAALQKALENTDARAEYVSVFDSDFVPYPDTIAQFVKSFQESCGGLDNVKNSNIAAVQGYQWHVLNKSQNWVTRGVRSEYAGSYVIERAGIGVYGGLNMIAGSVFAIRADILRGFAWGRSITEDFELTLRLYERGYKVLFTPYIQAPAEAVSTVRRLIRQRMRWAEGHTFNIRKMASRILASPYVNRREKGEFVYLAPYYLQAAFFIVGTIAWLLSEIVFKVRLPFWTAAWGWSLVFVNFLSLPLMNLVGLFLEESEERDYLGIASFMVLSYIVVPFQAYAAVKALFEPGEGPWFRTPKTGDITDAFDRVSFYKFFDKFKSLGRGGSTSSAPAFSPAIAGFSAYNKFSGYNIRVRRSSFISKGFLAVILISVMFINYLTFFAPSSEAHHGGVHLEQQLNILDRNGYDSAATDYTSATSPTSDSLGLVQWDANNYTSASAYFEASLRVTPDDVGRYSSIYCISNTNCKTAYYDATNGNLMFADCSDATCTSTSASITTVDSTGDVGKWTALNCVGGDTDCKIAYYDVTNSATKFVDCGTSDCSATGRAIRVVDGTTCGGITGCNNANDTGQQLAMDCPSATTCHIIYRDVTQNKTVHANCTNADCTTGNVTALYTNGATLTDNRAKAIDCVGGDANCKILTNTYTNALALIDCTADVTCATNTQTGVNGSAYSAYGTALDCPTTTDCKVVYNVMGNTLYFTDCGDATCTSGSATSTIIDGASCVLTGCGNGSFTDPSIFCQSGTECRIAYADGLSNYDLKFIQCDNSAACSSGQVRSPDTTNQTGYKPSIFCIETSAGAGDAPSNCKVSEYYNTLMDFRVVDCDAADCNSKTVTTVDGSTGATAKANIFPQGGGSTATTCTGGGSAEVTTTYEQYTRVRTSCTLSLTNGTAYTVRVSTSDASGHVQINAARIIIIQQPASGQITDTEASVEVGDSQTGITGTTYAAMTRPKYYCFDTQDTGTSCTDTASVTTWDPAPTVYFEATLTNNTSAKLTYAELYDITAGAAVASSPVSCGPSSSPSCGTTQFNLKRSGSITLTAGHVYEVRVQVDSGSTGAIANAHIILYQSAAGGVVKTETIQMYNNYQRAVTTSTVDYWPNRFERNNLERTGETVTYFNESDMINTNCPKNGTCGSDGVSLYNADDLTGISSSSANTDVDSVLTRVRGTDISANLPAAGSPKNLVILISPYSGQTLTTNKTWLIIQISDLNVPEIALAALPIVFFIPKVINKLTAFFRRRRKSALLLIENG